MAFVKFAVNAQCSQASLQQVKENSPAEGQVVRHEQQWGIKVTTGCIANIQVVGDGRYGAQRAVQAVEVDGMSVAEGVSFWGAKLQEGFCGGATVADYGQVLEREMAGRVEGLGRGGEFTTAQEAKEGHGARSAEQKVNMATEEGAVK